MKQPKMLRTLFACIYLSLFCMTNCYYAKSNGYTEKSETINFADSYKAKSLDYCFKKLKDYFVVLASAFSIEKFLEDIFGYEQAYTPNFGGSSDDNSYEHKEDMENDYKKPFNNFKEDKYSGNQYQQKKPSNNFKEDKYSGNQYQQKKPSNNFKVEQNEKILLQRWVEWKRNFQRLNGLEKSRYSESLQPLYNEINDLSSNCNSFSFTNKDEIMSFIGKCQSYKKGCNNDAVQLLDSIRVILGQIKRKI